MRGFAAVAKGFFVTTALTGCTLSAVAQWREGPRVLEAPHQVPVEPPADFVTPFARAYEAAGRPRVVLLWNRSLSDESSTSTVQRKVTRDTGTTKTGGSTQSTNGPAGSVTVTEGASEHDNTRTETSGPMQLREAARKSTFSERETTMLERAFVGELDRAGVRFVDRAMVMRTTAATQHRAGGDQQLIETDSLMKHSDVVLEVVFIEDRDAPSGYVFDVRAKDVRRGFVISTTYSRAVPPRRPPGVSSWRPGAAGYEFKAPPEPPPPGILEFGRALARDVMADLGPAWRKRP